MSKVILFLLLLPCSLLAQTNRYFVSFKDKANSVYSLSNPWSFLSQKSIDRRARENFELSEEDLPVNASYVQQVKATGAEVYFTSRWFNGLLIQTNPTIVATIQNLPFVSKVELVGYGSRLVGGRVKANQKMEQLNSTAITPSVTNQSKMIGLDEMHADGIYGEGVDVAIFDAGFTGVSSMVAFQPIYQQGRVKATYNFVTNSTNVYSSDRHGTWVFSIMAGNIPSYQGGVPKANFFLYRTEDVNSEYRIEEYNWLFAAEKADSAGVDVINSSLGYNWFDDFRMDYEQENMDGKTTVVARAARKAVERGIVVVNSAGNEGSNAWGYIVSPSDAAGVISVGAVDSLRIRTSFSSYGPSADGRTKPDVSAQGQYTAVIDSDGLVKYGNGTSFSSPLVASLAAGLRQAFPNASAAEIYSRITNSASQAGYPDDLTGFGIPNYRRAQAFTEFDSPVRIYPNPAVSQLKVIFKNPKGQYFRAMLFNSAGQKVFETFQPETWLDNPLEIDMSRFATGVFVLKVETAEGVMSQRIIKVY